MTAITFWSFLGFDEGLCVAPDPLPLLGAQGAARQHNLRFMVGRALSVLSRQL